jgi:DNA-binding transcriptional ArsR family regulator
MDAIFRALADPSRRNLLDRLNECQGQTLSDLCNGMGMRRQSVTKHLKILETAGLVTVEWRGRKKFHYLNPIPIAEIGTRWIDKFSKSKAEAVAALKSVLEEQNNEPT